MQSIPILLEGKDLIGQSKTGSGKTAAFSLPILEKINLRTRSVQALVLCPTRELCTQVAREIRRLGRRHSGLQVLIISGGQPFFPQKSALEKGVHIVVGTPGRILDHLRRRTLDLSQVSTLVLDEADRMLEMGFQDDMEEILSEVPASRQTVLFSATFPKQIESLSKNYQQNPERVTIQDESQVSPQIQQMVYEAHPNDKPNGLLRILAENRPESTIVFCNLKATVIELTRSLIRAGVSAACIHGDLEQFERDRVMAKFRNQSVRVLVATDVAARGIDVANLDLVVNYDLPPQLEVYVHRIGRTGRAGKTGLAIAFATAGEKWKIQEIQKIMGAQIERKTLNVDLNVEVAAPAPAIRSNTAENAPGSASGNIPAAEASKLSFQQDAKMATLYISGGRKDKVRPGDILGALTGEAGGLSGTDIGKIEIHDRFSYVAISKSVAELTLQKLRCGKIKGRKFIIDLVR
jgi:ATP-independent RNA helicase DbpA